MSRLLPEPAGAVHWLQVPPTSVRSLAELRLAAAARCAFLHGGAPEDWLIEGEWNAVHPFVCAGVRREHAGGGDRRRDDGMALPGRVRGDGWHAVRVAAGVSLWHQTQGRVDALAMLAIPEGEQANEAIAQRMQLEAVNEPVLRPGPVQWHAMPPLRRRGPTRAARIAAAVTAAGLAAAAALAWHAWEAASQLAVARLQTQEAQRRAAAQASRHTASRLTEAERQAWSNIAHQLSTPWSGLLDALEAATPEHVALVAVEPDVRQAAVRIQAEARSLDALLEYAQHLAAVPLIAQVSLIKHETNEQDPNKPLRLGMELRIRIPEAAR